LQATIEAIPELILNSSVETNQLFFSLPESWISRLQEKVGGKERNAPLFLANGINRF
jgi:hypothetical protein